MALTIKKATKTQAKLRMTVSGPSGSGKTWTALRLGSSLLDPGERLGFIDTERGSASKYSDHFDFDVIELTDSFHPERYMEAMKAFADAGYKVVVVDSLTHAWTGKDGGLDLQTQAERKQRGGNSYTAWREVTPVHNALVDAMLQAPFHLITTMRTKTEYVLEANDKGKMVPKKVGTAPVQRAGMEYEFDIWMDMDLEHVGTVSKTRCHELTDKQFIKPGEDMAKVLKTWLTTGAPAPVAVPAPAAVPPAPAAAPHPMTTVLLAAVRLPDLLSLVPELQKLPDSEKPLFRELFNKRYAELCNVNSEVANG